MSTEPTSATAPVEPIVNCEWCQEPLTAEEIEYPCRDDENICDECWREHYQFTCHWCEEYDDKDRECAIGSLFAIFEPVSAKEPIIYRDGKFQPAPEWYDTEERAMKPGIYRITQWPMYWDEILDGGLYANSFERVGDLTEEMQEHGGYAEYPCGPLCRECEAKFSN